MRLPFVAAPPWWVGARCRSEEIPLSLFFSRDEVGEARRVCADCLVRIRCLTEHLDEPFGVWGGHARDDRARIRSEMDLGATIESASLKITARRKTPYV
ncbi:WhiB family transcriptional regulator [Arenimonas sp.]|uniref:WhiB family transcriptional regulator n=1 Tax=Arenimonas sp. TaxID=1872635 RepID=UPI0037BED0C2